jgi:5'-nucleotidase
MKIFLTNDDGIHAEGLWALHRVLASRHEVTVIAPDRERSAVGHGITLHKPLRTVRIRSSGNRPAIAVSGTPVDCIKLGLLEILRERPELVVSGINPGANVGINLNYSGTVCAAKEAAIYGLPAIAVSMPGPATKHYETAAAFTAKLAAIIARRGLPPGIFLNVNVPDVKPGKIGGVTVSRQGTKLFSEFVERRTDPRNRDYYWQGCDSLAETDDREVDEAALCRGRISVTPIRCDGTAHELMAELQAWDLGDWPAD